MSAPQSSTVGVSSTYPRQLYLSDTEMGGDSTIFHTINRSKESFAVDMKDKADIAALKKLLARADVLIQNFQLGIIKWLGLGYKSVREINPRIVYSSITGYGTDGPWVKFPGQDLLAQSRSGVMWLNGDETQGPVPFGLAVGDMLAGAALCQGLLAALVRRGITGEGSHVETSLLEALVDFQFEVLTTHLNDGGRLPRRSAFRSAHAYLSAPYGVYPTQDGFLALVMTPIGKLANLLDLGEELGAYRDAPATWFTARDAALGGTSIAVSAYTKYPDQAIGFAYWIASGDMQCGPFAGNGGQPGHTAAWEDPTVNVLTEDFYSGTRTTLEGSFLRPHHDGYMAFQAAGSDRLLEGL